MATPSIRNEDASKFEYSTASTTALSIPLILETIFDAVYRSDDQWRQDKLLVNCALVNRLWFAEAVPLLWQDTDTMASGDRPDLASRLEVVSRLRRTYYANLVKRASFSTYEDEQNGSTGSRVLTGLKFPKLDHLALKLVEYGLLLPKIDGHAVKEFDIKTSFSRHQEPIYSSAKDMDVIIDQIVVLFPRLAVLKFLNWGTMHRKSVDSLWMRLPHLRILEQDMDGRGPISLIRA